MTRDKPAAEMRPAGLDLTDVPGIIVNRRPPEQTARILGTGIEVWEVARAYHEVGEDWARLRDCYGVLSEEQLRAALTFARKYWDLIEARIAENYACVPESFRDAIPDRWR